MQRAWCWIISTVMSDRLPISVLLLARDEERELERLLPALAFAQEVVVVCDPEGMPGVGRVAERHGARVFTQAFDGFGAQRQFALARCTQPWVLWIDADEWPDVALVDALRTQVAGAPGESGDGAAAGWRLRRRTWFLGRRIRFCGWGVESIVRGGRRERLRFDDAPVHERLMVDGPITELAGTLEHHSYPTIEVCGAKLTRYALAGAERAWRAGRRAGPADLLLRPPLRFVRQFVLQLGFLDGTHGLVLCGLAAAQVFLKYAALWERTRAAAAGRGIAGLPPRRGDGTAA
jgi:(heptosyl)LPS beta-1,4-glucosyltransferase